MDTGYPRIFEITPCEKHRQMHYDVKCADCEISRLQAENMEARRLLDTICNAMKDNLYKDNTIDLNYGYWIRKISAFFDHKSE